MEEAIRPIRPTLRFALLALPLFLLILSISLLLVFLEAPPEKNVPGGLIATFVVGCILVVQIWMVAVYRSESIVFDDDEVQFNHLLARRKVIPADVADAHWHKRRLKLTLRSGKEEIWFRKFSPSDQLKLVRFFRSWLSSEAQRGWSDDLLSPVVVVSRRVTWTGIALVVAGPAAGLVCSAIVGAYATYLGVREVASVSGLPALDWAILGLVVAGLTVPASWMLVAIPLGENAVKGAPKSQANA